jgi:ribosomal protein S12 methylthiotransferase
MASPQYQKAYWLDPYGCVKNQVDAETMMASLNAAGWRAAAEPAGADLIIINSCAFIDSAKQESIDAVLTYRKHFPDKKILLAGCLAQRYAPELAGSFPEADGFFGNAGDLAAVAGAAAAVLEGRGDGGAGNAAAVPAPPAGAASAAACAAGDRPLLSLPGSAYVKITEGCDNRCTFCAIPLIRGGLRSRPIPEVIAECKRLLERGVRELCLIGQDLGSYGRDRAVRSVPAGNSGPAVGSDTVMGSGTAVDAGAGAPAGGGAAALMALLEELSRLEGRFWVRLLYIHPDNFPLPILDLCRRDRRFLPYFDIPFQHASTAILRAMNRRGSAGSYLELIANIRAAAPGACIRSTFLTGFPGETEADFAELLRFQERAELEWAGAFTYSREEGTPAWGMKNRVAKKTALRRKKELEERQIPLTLRRMERFVGKTTEVLVEEKVEGEDGLFLGRLPCQAPEIDGSAVISSEQNLEPGVLYPGRIFARAGIDLEVRV